MRLHGISRCRLIKEEIKTTINNLQQSTLRKNKKQQQSRDDRCARMPAKEKQENNNNQPFNVDAPSFWMPVDHCRLIPRRRRLIVSLFHRFVFDSPPGFSFSPSRQKNKK